MPSIAHMNIEVEQPTRRRPHRAPRPTKAPATKAPVRSAENLEEVPRSRERESSGLDRNDSHSTMLTYFRELRRHPLLTREEEKSIATEFAQTGNPRLAKKLVTANLRLVVKIALEYRTARRNLLDLVQEGNVGLIHAVQKYDPNRGVKLATYASWWIRAYILKFLLSNARL